MKKIIAVLLVVAALFAFVSCSGGLTSSPTDLAKSLADKHGEDLIIAIAYDEQSINSLVSEFSTEIEGVYAVTALYEAETFKTGYVMYFASATNAKDAEGIFEEYLAQLPESTETEGIKLKRSGAVLFFGYEEILAYVEGE